MSRFKTRPPMAPTAGVIILFFFSFPQPSHQAYVGIAVESGTVLSDGRTAADHANDARLTRERYVFYSGCGMMLIIVGFVFQLIEHGLMRNPSGYRTTSGWPWQLLNPLIDIGQTDLPRHLPSAM